MSVANAIDHGHAAEALMKAIDDLLAYVKNHWRITDYGDGLSQFNTLDTAVYVAARHLGLQDSDMPRKDATFKNDDLVFFGRTNVPGTWNSPPDAPSTLALFSTQGWVADMNALRALAEAGIVRGLAAPFSEPDWTSASGPAQWARLFGVSRTTFIRRCKDGKIQHKKLSAKSYQIAVDDLPKKHQHEFRHAEK